MEFSDEQLLVVWHDGDFQVYTNENMNEVWKKYHSISPDYAKCIVILEVY